MSYKIGFFLLVLLAFVLVEERPAKAVVLSGISVSGNHRISTQSILEKTGLEVGKDVNSDAINIALKNLFSSGLFSDVKILPVGSRLLIQVQEASSVNEVAFRGNKKLKKEDLEHIVGTKPHQAFDATKMQADIDAIKRAYAYVGCKNVQVSAQSVPVGNGAINVIYSIAEGARAKISAINFTGNKSFSAFRLHTVLSIKKTNFLSWLTQSDVLSDARLEADKEALQQFYFRHGYADFRIISAQATYSAQANSYVLNYVLDEGPKYNFGTMHIESTISTVNPAALYKALETKRGNIYNIDNIQDSIIALNKAVQNSGYAFAGVNAHTDRDLVRHTISINYRIEEGPHLYVERIEIVGNDKTRDYVIRREFDIAEGDALNQSLIALAKSRLEKLGFFQSVEISTKPGSAPDQAILIVKVAEQATGQFSLGGGYTTGGQSPGFSLDASVRENNFLGRGQQVSLSAKFGQDQSRDYTFSFLQPYFLDHRISAGFSLFKTTYRPHNDYGVRQMGGSTHFSFVLNDKLSADVAYNYINERYDLSSSSSIKDLRQQYAGAIVESASKSWLRSSLRYALIYSSLDSLAMPREGTYMQISQEFAGIGGDAHYLKTTLRGMEYITLSQQYDIVAFLAGGYGDIYRSKKYRHGVRVFDLFQNDTNMVRGFKYNGLGPQQKSGNGTNYFIGGGEYINATAELQYPIPFAPETLGLRGAFFADAGTVYDNPYDANLAVEEPVTHNKFFLRTSVGASLYWSSPLGPLRFDYAVPIKKDKGDLTQTFSFGVSTRF